MVAGGPAAMQGVKAAGRKVIEDVRTLPTLSGFTPDSVSALTVAQSKYPRLFGHLGKVEANPTLPNPGTTFFGLGKPRMELAPEVGTAARDTIGHELAHVAQNVRNPKDFLPIYKKMDEMFGYAKNPFESRARRVGASFADKLDNPLANELTKRVK